MSSMQVQLHLNDPPLLRIRQTIQLHFFATTYEPSEDSGLGITNTGV